MKISDYPLVAQPGSNDVLLVETEDGTKTVSAESITGGQGTIMSTVDDICDWYDEIEIPYTYRRNIFRGKNLGSEFTAEQKAHIADGSFKGFFIGDYWETSDNRYRIADINYWLHTGDTECTTNHLVIVPDKGDGSPQKMNTTETSSGGYLLSNLRQYPMNDVLTKILEVFDNSVLNHMELLTNAVSNGYPSGGVWHSSIVELLNEPMVYGAYMCSQGATASNHPYLYTIDKTQLSLFKLHPEFIVLREDDGTRRAYWLRDVTSSSSFAIVIRNGESNYTYASNVTCYIRPVFGIIG